MSEDSRQRILYELKRLGAGTVAQLSERLGLTPVTIRHHLQAMIQDGVVAPPIALRAARPGRPRMEYRLTDRAASSLPRNYGALSIAVMHVLAQRLTPTETEAFLREAGAHLGEQVSQDWPSASAKRTAPLIAYLRSCGYFPSWGSDQHGPRLDLAHCPYLEAAQANPSVCAFDLALVGVLLGTPVEAEARIALQEHRCLLRPEASAGD